MTTRRATRSSSSMLLVTAAMLLGAGCDDPSEISRQPDAARPHPAAVALAKLQVPAATATDGELYVQHCAACHGTTGDGLGQAARYLNPKARDLRTSPFRLVSTANGVPSSADVEAVLRRGIPGAAMRSYEELGEAAIQKLVREVFRLRREGMREHILRVLRDELLEDQPMEEEVQQILDVRLLPGSPVVVPHFGVATPDAIARGKATFGGQACRTCHGDSGTGETELCLTNQEGFPTRPRDLVHGDLKGGRDCAAVYLRIHLGMPGTPMAANPLLSPNELVDLVHYCRALGRDRPQSTTNYERSMAAIHLRSMLATDEPLRVRN